MKTTQKRSLVTTATLLILIILASVQPVFSQQIYRPAVRTSPPLLRDSNSRVERWFEVRAGPRLSLVDGTLRPGLNGSSSLDLRDDLQLTDPGVGGQLDFAMRVAKDWIASVNFSVSTFDGPNVTTTRNLFYQTTSNPGVNQNTQANPARLPTGSNLQASIDLASFEGAIQYEAYKTSQFVIGPKFGFKYLNLDEKITIRNATTGAITTDRTNVDEVTPLVGFVSKFNFTKNLYTGIEPMIFAGERFVYITGQAYFGYDFDKQDWGSMGLRLGLDADQIWNNHSGSGSARYNIQATMLTPFLEVVYGF